MRVGTFLLVAMAVLAACDADTRDLAGEQPTIPGRLAVVDDRGAVVIASPDGSSRVTLATGDPAVQHWQPTWAPDGRHLTWSESSTEGSVLVVSNTVSASRIAMPALPFYWMWSPDGDEIAVLHGGRVGALELEIVDVDEATTSVVAAGAPFFVSWSPSGDRLLAHVGLETLALVDVDGLEVLEADPSQYQTPAWTPAGIFHGRGDALVRRASPEADPADVATTPGPLSIVASPSGDRLAVQAFGPPDEPSIFASVQTVPDLPAHRVVVVDAASGDVVTASTDPAFAFFWSPDGSMLLLLVAGSEEGQLEWRVWHEGGVLTTQGFVPNQTLVRDLVPFFDQYAQSWTPWAPDGSAFAFAGRVDGDDGVWVRRLESSEPRFVATGTWVAWSSG